MRLRLREDSLPRWAKDIFPGIRVDAWEIIRKPSPSCPTSLRTKVCFFHSRKDLRAAWNRLCLLRGDGPKHHCMGQAIGFVHQCWQVWDCEDGKSEMRADGLYSSIICLLAPSLNYEVIAHEALHASLAHARRVARDPDFNPSDMSKEELIAYPCGFITHMIIHVARKQGWLT